MSFRLTARCKFDALTDIPIAFLESRGCELLLLDLDNTIAPYGEPLPRPEVTRWVQRVTDAGITAHIVSNSRKTERVKRFADALGVRYVVRARKPFPVVMRTVIDGLNVPPQRAVMVGDQIFTDTLGANLAGAVSVIVKPIRLSNALLALRYAAESPFRLLTRKDTQQ
ncbi:MAG: YqeG family HAD IIIA-type phosphatase [Oscillospiraceae bacterium]|jgi:HAD superfamily phosphatase (TIGR01668 family)|nr:YqeG family HAD IIIA-type phosphatase [Oscillospiraceae bacterium]